MISKVTIQNPILGNYIDHCYINISTFKRLDGRAIQKVLREIDTSTLAYALVGAENEITDKVLSNMSQRASDMMKSEIDAKSSAADYLVEDARQRVSSAINRLVHYGEIVI